MQRLSSIISFFVMVVSISAQDGFLTTWETAGPMDTVHITINSDIGSALVKYDIDWGDGNIDTEQETSVYHNYANPGNYQIKITGSFPGIEVDVPAGNGAKLISIDQWGSIEWTTMQNAFKGANFMIYKATDAPDLSLVTDMSSMFSGAAKFEGSINHWDVSHVQNMGALFYEASQFNKPLDMWDVSSVTEMSYMFSKATSFNQPINSWDVRAVIRMQDVFNGASAFNQPLYDWEPINVVITSSMFKDALAFNQPLENWTVSTFANLTRMFDGAISFNQSLGDWKLNSAWSVQGLLDDCGMNMENYEKTLQFWSQHAGLPSNLTLGANQMTYCVEAAARQSLIDHLNWTINGDVEVCPENAFVTTWRTTSANENITILTNPDYTYDYSIDWENDGIIDDFSVSGDLSHTYPSAGDHEVAIYGRFPQFLSNGTSVSPDLQLIEINQWGNIQWESFESSFFRCSFLTYEAMDTPDLTSVTNLSGAFAACSQFNGNINDWDVSTIEDMSGLFGGASVFNQPLDNWDVCNVLDMNSMFINADSFNQPLSSWDVSNVMSMERMFSYTESFNQPLNSWDVSNVESMTYMFASSLAFNQNLGNWNTSSVENMLGMFWGAVAFNQPLKTEFGFWNTANVRSMDYMFYNASSFDQTIEYFDLSSVISMNNMLSGSGLSIEHYDNILIAWSDQSALRNNITLGVEGLNYCLGRYARIKLINDFNWTLSGDSALCPFVTTWRTTEIDETITILTDDDYDYNFDIDWQNDGVIDAIGVTGDLSHTYPEIGVHEVAIYGDFPHFVGTRFNNSNRQLIDIDQWGVIEWRSMTESFKNCRNLQYSARDRPDLSLVHDLDDTFKNCNAFNGDIGDWDVSGITSMSGTFSGAHAFNRPLSDWDVSNVTDMSQLFSLAFVFNQPLSEWDVSNVVSMRSMFSNAEAFNQSLSEWDVSNVKNMGSMFSSAEAFDQEIENWDVSNVVSMRSMFSYATMFNRSLSLWETDSLRDIANMFSNAVLFDQPLNHFEVGNVTDMTSAFEGAIAFNQALDGWNTENVINMRRMFSGAVLFDQAIGSWDVSKVKNMAGMFADALRFNQPLNQWETDSLQYIDAIFSNAELFNQSLNNWDVSKVADMSRVFKNASSFDQDLSSWNIERVGTSDEDEDYSMEDMLSNSGMSIANYDATLTGWSIQNVDDDVRLGATGLEFCDGASARQILIDDFGWEILGDFECGMLPPCESVTSNEYIGAVVGDWDVDANWSLGRVPEHCDDVIIAGDNNSVISVTVSTDASCAFLEIELGVSFEITNGAVFEVKAPQIDIEEGEQ